MTPTPRRRRLRVSVGGLMILVLIVALPLGWVANTIRTQRAAIAAVRAANGTIMFDYEGQPNPVGPTAPAPRRTEPAAPRWLRRWLGDELFQRVRMVYFNDPTSPTILAQVGHFEQLQHFSLNSPLGAGDGSLHLDRARSLSDLGLSGPWVDDAILAEIARLPALQALRLHNASATEAGFALLVGHPGLQNLSLRGCPNLTDAGLARLLAGLPSLRSLTFHGGPSPQRLAEAAAALARDHPDLRNLTIYQSNLTDDDLAVIGRLDRLEFLTIDSRVITDAGVAYLRSLGRLRSLRISAPGLTDAGLEPLAGLTTLERLSLDGGQITDAGMATIARLDRLKQLQLPSCLALTDAGLIPLHRLANLQHLDVVKARVTPAGVAALRQALPKLRTVRTSR